MNLAGILGHYAIARRLGALHMGVQVYQIYYACCECRVNFLCSLHVIKVQDVHLFQNALAALLSISCLWHTGLLGNATVWADRACLNDTVPTQ